MVRSERTRLRWYNQKDGTIVSEPVLAGSVAIRVHINPKTFSLEVRDTNGKYCYAAGSAKSISLLKKLGKQKLVDSHAKFFDEVRIGMGK